MTPPALDRPLPTRWDGHPVTWGSWSATPRSTLDLHLAAEHPDAVACPGCGTLPPPTLTATGVSHAPDRDLQGRTLTAHRCTLCGHDTVHTTWDGMSWDLGPEDYGPAGSTLDAAEHYAWED